MFQKFVVYPIIVISMFFLSACTNSPKAEPSPAPESAKTDSTSDTETALSTPVSEPIAETEKVPNALCDWIDESDVILQLIFPEGVETQSAYTAGFTYARGNYPSYYLGRIARQACDYRVGFTLEETTEILSATVTAWGFDNSEVVHFVKEPIVHAFVDGVPVAGKTVKAAVDYVEEETP